MVEKRHTNIVIYPHVLRTGESTSVTDATRGCNSDDDDDNDDDDDDNDDDDDDDNHI